MAIKYYAGNRLTGVSGDTKPTSNVITGTTFLETNTDDLYLWDGDSWNVVASNTGTEILSNKSFSDSLVFDEISVPGNAATDKVRLYAKSGGKLYSKDDSGNEFDLTAGAGSASNMTGLTDTDISSVGSAHVLVYDGSNSWDNKAVSGDITIATTGATTLGTVAITGQTAETTIQGASDLVLIYDNSASAFRKVTISNLLAGGVSADTLNALNDTTLSGLSAAHVLIYDGTDSWDNKAVSGDITINASGVTAITSGVIVNADVNASAAIVDTKLATIATANKVSGSAVQLAGTSAIENSSGLQIKAATAGAGLAISSQVLSVGVDDSSIEINSDALRVKASGITNTMLANSTITIGGTATALGGTITALTALTDIDLTAGAKTIFDTVGNAILTIGASNTTVAMAGDLTVTGDFTVSGDTTTVSTATLTVEDPLMALANNNTTNSVDIGFYGKYRTNGTDLYTGLVWDGSASQYILFHANQAVPSTTVNTSGTGHAVSTLVANITGDVSGSSGTSTGLAGSATILATGRTIAASGDITWTSASFNGSANVTGVAAITADVIINADVKTDAAIAYSKLAALADGNILVGNGSNVATSVNPSGDIDVTNAGVFSIAAGVIINADVNASAAIVDTKLATISTANKVGLAALDIDGGTEIGANIVDADLFIIDDGAGGTNRKTLASRLKTYIGASGEANEYAFKTIAVSGQTNVVADTTTDTLTFAQGTGITLTTNASTDTITITNSSTGASESFAIAMAVAL